jgi:hypothetical protein
LIPKIAKADIELAVLLEPDFHTAALAVGLGCDEPANLEPSPFHYKEALE